MGQQVVKTGGSGSVSEKRVIQPCGSDPLDTLSIVASDSQCEGDFTPTTLYALAAIFLHHTAVSSAAIMDCI